ncbi:hypothetical protein [Sedimenticola sp.]|uniref:hypothetical protein n=1 Tax=Sedimenticola sp. TaxID=1940285 RepID=UPI003D0D4DCB
MRWILFGLLWVVLPLHAQQIPQVLGYGVKGCDHYNRVFEGWENGQGEQIAEYIHYQDWLTGLVTGLSLATGMDVLKGVEIKGALRRIQVYCDEHPTDDFFTASMDLVRILSGLK